MSPRLGAFVVFFESVTQKSIYVKFNLQFLDKALETLKNKIKVL
jgi:hypothetical protein